MNRVEAELLTGEADAARAAAALVARRRPLRRWSRSAPTGPCCAARWRPTRAGVGRASCSTVGAGDALTGVLLAALSAGGFDPAVLADALAAAVRAGAAATERWGAAV